jgi:hypothetical protein
VNSCTDDIKMNALIIDPRSPTNQYKRTPIQFNNSKDNNNRVNNLDGSLYINNSSETVDDDSFLLPQEGENTPQQQQGFI